MKEKQEKVSGNIGTMKKKNYVKSSKLPAKVTKKSSAQFVIKAVPKKGMKMLGKAMKKLAKKK